MLCTYICCRYSHPNLVLVLGVCADPEHPAIIYEFMENGSLSELLFGHSPKVTHLCVRFASSPGGTIAGPQAG